MGDRPCQAPLGCIDGEGLSDVCGMCGAPGQTCCAGGDDACVADHRCLSPTKGEPATCRPCGGMDQPCCLGDRKCRAPLGCMDLPGDADRCAGCGAQNQPCCGGAMPCMGSLKCLSAPNGDSEICMP